MKTAPETIGCSSRDHDPAISSALEAALLEALTPSAATKAHYIGEFAFDLHYLDDFGEDAVRSVQVPWTTIKEIMADIKARALSRAEQVEGKVPGTNQSPNPEQIL